MKKLGLLSIIGCSVSGVAIAAGVDCSVIPTCAEMGFTKSVTDCDGKTLLRCPFDITNDNAVFCPDGITIDESYNLDACPANAVCDEQGGKFKFQGCETGYTQTEENTCCSDSYYNLTSKPDNATFEQCGNKYHLTSCNDGYGEENGTCVLLCSQDYSLDTCPTNGNCTECGGKQKLESCTNGYTVSGNTCIAATCAGQTSTTGCKTYSGTCLSGTTTYYLCTECYTGYKLSSNKCTKTCTYTNTTVLTDEYCKNLKQGYNHADSCVRGSASGNTTYYGCVCNPNSDEICWN